MFYCVSEHDTALGGTTNPCHRHAILGADNFIPFFLLLGQARESPRGSLFCSEGILARPPQSTGATSWREPAGVEWEGLGKETTSLGAIPIGANDFKNRLNFECRNSSSSQSNGFGTSVFDVFSTLHPVDSSFVLLVWFARTSDIIITALLVCISGILLPSTTTKLSISLNTSTSRDQYSNNGICCNGQRKSFR